MSTRQETLRQHVRSGVLVPWPLHGALSGDNVLALVAAVANRIRPPWGDDNDPNEALRQQVIETCSAFVQDQVTLRQLFGLLGRRDGSAAAMRILAPAPGVRIVGGFLTETVFVGTALYRRNELPFKHASDPNRPQRADWKQVQTEFHAAWRDIFGGIPPVTPSSLRRRQIDEP